MKSAARSLAILLAVGLISSCSTGNGALVKGNRTFGELRGMVYDWDRQPLPDATVTLASEPPTAALTDLHGRFGLGTVPFGAVALQVSKPGYETLSWEFRFSEGGEILYVQLASRDQLFERAAQALERKDWQEFQSYWDRGRFLDPASLQGFVLGAIALELQGRVDEAISLLEQNPHPQPVFAIEVLLGDLYSQKGQAELAAEHWKAALGIREDAGVRWKEKMDWVRD